jgi:hypothetical protein
VETTQWIIAIGSLGSALVALALGLGLGDWLLRPRVRLVLGDASDSGEDSDRIVTKRIESGETAAFVRLRLENRGRSTARNAGVRLMAVRRWDPVRGRWLRARPELDGRGDNVRPERSFFTLTFDGRWSPPGSPTIWEHFLVRGPSPRSMSRPPPEGIAWASVEAEGRRVS